MAREMEDVLHFKESLTEFAKDVYDKIIKLQAAKEIRLRKPNLLTHGLANLANSLTELPNAEARICHINAWVAKNTKDKIKELLPPNIIQESSKLVLINSLYFR
ncbi:hypothetical protein T265_15209, partial [Opisthorchis viverrini]